MMMSSNGNIFRVTGPLRGEFTGHRWIPHTKASDAKLWCFFMICAWINGWVNNREAGDLRRHRAHNDVIVMYGLHRMFPNVARIMKDHVFHKQKAAISFSKANAGWDIPIIVAHTGNNNTLKNSAFVDTFFRAILNWNLTLKIKHDAIKTIRCQICGLPRNNS